MNYIDLCAAKDHLRVDHDEDDFEIELKIKQASSMVKSYLKDVSPYEPQRDADDTPVYDSAGDFEVQANADGTYTVRYEVQAATLLLVQMLYDRDWGDMAWERGFLPAPVVSLLYPLRDPTIA